MENDLDLFSGTRRAILAMVLFQSPDDAPYFQSQIVQRVGRGTGAVTRELKELVRKNILLCGKDGKRKTYTTNLKHPRLNAIKELIEPVRIPATKSPSQERRTVYDRSSNHR